MSLTNRTDLINLIAQKIDAKTYVEIGVYNPDHNFNKINIENKIGVDPDPNAGATFRGTSDEFFKIARNMDSKVDLVFIDGLHHADQVKTDIQNAWDILSLGGVIVLHDCNPPSEATTCVPRGSQREWCGDTFRAICQIQSPEIFTVDFDYGCAVIRNEMLVDTPLHFADFEVTWEQFNAFRKRLLKLKSVEEATEIINAWI
jgi:hypothetical protein